MGVPGRRMWMLAVALMPALSLGAQAASSGLASHRAIYEMTLKSASRSSDIAELSGQMLIEVIDVCDGWTLEQRIAITIVNFQGQEVVSHTGFTSWESRDGSRFRFEQKTKQNDIVVEKVGGKAAVDPDGGGLVVFGEPEANTLELAPGTLFPSQHTALLIASAKAGKSFVSRVVFDGTSADGPNQISAFIAEIMDGPMLPGEAVAPRVWPIHLAFYRASSSAPEPDVEISMLVEANGVMRQMTLDYGNFSIDGRLGSLGMLPAPDC